MIRRVNLIEESFLPVILLFNITGLRSYHNGAFLKYTRFHRFILESPRYLFIFLQCLGIITQAISVALSPEKKRPVVILILALLQFTINEQTRRSRKQIQAILMKLWKCSQMLQWYQNERKLRISIFAYCCGMTVTFTSFFLLYRFSNDYEIYRSLIENSDQNFPKLKQYFTLFPDISVIVIPATVAVIFISLTGYYGFVCFYIKFLFNRIEEKIGHLNKDCSYGVLIQSYLELTSIMKSLDDYLSFSAFVIVLSALLGLFFINFELIFNSGDYLHAIFGEIWYLVSVCMIILPASATNSAFFTAKETIQTLPWKIPQYYTNLKVMIRSECTKDVSLTLWKVYKIKRSLIFGAMGTLVTYGMLLATQGGPK
ncbi:uncharacterized protein TNIN_454371 [Trichonephila inaurata madagascariensis]|uniref:Gustatory receptor n=1 Tax=Trichonephila inaurata madagascariensis TaxID=2747483 RepID=A0A8X6IWX0_9ARAC|nr:uncharacterized protein TNIN_454371 [Trichonephila inaurata madagascariensis]